MLSNTPLRSWMLPSSFFLVSLAVFACFHPPYLEDLEAYLTAGILEADASTSIELARSNPGYRFAARILNAFIGDAQTSLLWLNHLAGAAGIALIALFGRLCFNSRIGALAAAILLISPIYFRHSVNANSALPALVCALGAFAIFAGRSSSRAPLIGSGLLLGFSVGIHFSMTPLCILATVGFYYILRDWKRIMTLAAGVFGGIAAWLIPALLSGQYIPGSQSPPANRGLIGFLDFPGALISDWAVPFLLLAFLSALSLCLLAKNPNQSGRPQALSHNKTVCALYLLWIAVAAFTLSPLASLPPIALLLAASIGVYWDRSSIVGLKRRILLALFIAISLGFYNQAKLGIEIRTTTPPSIQAANFVRSQFDPKNAFINFTASSNSLAYFLSDYESIDSQAGDPLTPRSLKPSARFILSNIPLPEFVQSEIHSFKRPGETAFDLYVYDTNQSTVFWESNSFDQEDWGRWIPESASGFARANSAGETQLRLSVRSSFPDPKRLEIRIDNQVVWSQRIPIQDTDYIIDLPLDRDGSTIEFRSLDGCRKPSDLGDSSDERCLAFAITKAVVGKQLYRMNERIGFNRDSSNIPNLSRGWSTPNEELAWTDAEQATFLLDFDKPLSGALELQIEGHFHLDETLHPRITIECWINETLCDTRTIEFMNRIDPRFSIPETVHRRGRVLDVQFRFDGLKSPQEIGVSDDSRQLGLAIRSLAIVSAQ